MQKFYETGELLSECIYSKDGLNGNYTTYYKNGFQDTVATLKNGKIVDKLKTYREDGLPLSLEDYVDGQLYGERFLYQRNGGIWRREKYYHGLLDGFIREYDAEGRISYEDYYHNNIQMNRKEFNTDGTIKNVIEY